MEAILAGLALGLGSGLAPGPLLGLTLSVSLTQGARAGVQVALSPLLTDTAIILLTLTVLSQLPTVAITAVTLLGAVVVAYVACETWQAAREPGLVDELGAPGASAKRATWPAWLQGVALNILNPAAWLFWATAGSALLIGFWRDSPAQAIAFLAAFYLMLVGTKVVLALSVSAGRERVSMRTYRWLLVAATAMLVAVAIGLAIAGVRALLN